MRNTLKLLLISLFVLYVVIENAPGARSCKLTNPLFGVDSIPTNCSKWTTLADTMPVRLHSAAIGVINGTIYVAGGIVSDQNGAASVTESYNPTTHVTAVLAPLPTPRQYVTGAVLNDTFYCIGGATTAGPYFGTPSAVVEAYDPVSNTWTRRADMPTARAGACATEFNGFIYVIGGGDSVNALTTVERYDSRKDRWTTETPLPQPRIFASATVGCNHLFVFGGAPTDERNCVEYNTGPDQWSFAGNLLAPTSNAAIISASPNIAKVFIFGGLPGYSVMGEEYTQRDSSFIGTKNLPIGRANLMAAIVGNYVYLIGGEQSPDNNIAQIDRFATTYIYSRCIDKICPGDSVTLTASGPGGHNFQWFVNDTIIPGATDSTHVATDSTTYTVTMMLEDGCADSARFGLVSSAPRTSISLQGLTSFCEGDSAILTAAPAGMTYSWSKDGIPLGQDSAQLIVKTSGKYSVIVTNSGGCAAADTISVTATQSPILLHLTGPTHSTPEGQLDTVALYADPLATLQKNFPLNVSVKYDSSTLGYVSTISTCNPVTVQNDIQHGILDITIGACPATVANPIASLVFQSVVGTTLNPMVQVLSSDSTNSCLSIQGSDTVISLTPFGCQLSTLDVSPFASKIISVSPNPTKGDVQLQFGLVDEVPVNITLEDILGRPIRTLVDGIQKPGTYSVTFPTDDIPAGAYFIRYLTQDAHDARELHISR